MPKDRHASRDRIGITVGTTDELLASFQQDRKPFFYKTERGSKMIRFPFTITAAYLDDPKHPITIPIEFRGDLYKSGLKKTMEVSITWPNGQSSKAAIYSGQRTAVEGGEQYPYNQIRARGGFRSALTEGLEPGDTIEVEIRPNERFTVVLRAENAG